MGSHLLRGAECSLFFRYTSWLTLHAIDYLKQSITANKRVGDGTMAMGGRKSMEVLTDSVSKRSLTDRHRPLLFFIIKK